MEDIFTYFRNKSTGWHLTKTARLVTRLYNEGLAAYDISASQSGILIILHEAAERNAELTQQDLSEILFLNKVNTHNLLKRLFQKHLIIKRQSSLDQRCKFIELSNEGRALIASIRAVDKRISQILTKQLKNASAPIRLTHFDDLLLQLLKTPQSLP